MDRILMMITDLVPIAVVKGAGFMAKAESRLRDFFFEHIHI